MLELVTPVRVSTTIRTLDELTGYAVLEVRFVPEPSTASLLGVGLASLGWGARKRSAVKRVRSARR